MGSESLPLATRIELDGVCDAFAKAWEAGGRPRIEDYLGARAEPERTILFLMLLDREIALRMKGGQEPQLGDYVERLPFYGELIRTVFESRSGRGWIASCAVASTEPGTRNLPAVPTDSPAPASTEPFREHSHETTIAGTALTIPAAQPPEPAAPAIHAAPEQIGRFQVDRLLAQGNFEVYLARDPRDGRSVAIKTARPGDQQARRWIMSLAAEAKKLEGLDHPGIVKVYEYVADGADGTDQNGFLVLEYVEGQTLAELFQTGRPPPLRLAGIVAMVAEAVHHVHTHVTGLVHRDLKPSNILLDNKGDPHVCDFGLAIEEEVQRARRHEVAGTLSYMAPEQVRGETHRLDGRTDIWALGVILYRGLTGRLPFPGRGENEVFEEILHRDPKPPRMYDAGIDSELERICLRCLSRSMGERYLTAADLAEDLRSWMAGAEAAAPAGAPPPVVPKGLMAFDVEDARFFPALLPGPRRGDGLPESIRFWKDRIESLTPDKAFCIGLLYGPSGGGKSSFVKAGLLPNLNKSRVRTSYVEAAPAGTEARLLAELRRAAPSLGPAIELPAAIARLRDDRTRRPAEKLLLVLDQFEQWLQTHPEPDAVLVRALRHCDGKGVQALVLVRDEFWMGVTRFLRAVEVPLVQGGNAAAVELFDARHARKVLEGFGQALGRLPADSGTGLEEASQFLDEAVKGLTGADGRVIPVRLSVFAEVVRHRPWTLATLRALGGVEGIGVKFLEDRFESASSPYRHERKACQAVLAALLPPPSSVIRGAPRSEGELRKAAGYGDRRGDFAELLRLLDHELRLVTPTDPHHQSAPEETRGLSGPPAAATDQTWYQLAHDFLIRPIRVWLDREQGSTRAGRARLRLKLVTASWQERPGPRQLPSLLEWAGMLRYVRPGEWTSDERRLVHATARHYISRGAAAVVLVAVLALGAVAVRHRDNARALWTAARSAGDLRLQALIPELEPYQSLLVRNLEATEGSVPAAERAHEREVAGILLYRFAPTAARGRYLRELLLVAPGPDRVELIRDALAAHPERAGTEALWQNVADSSAEPGQRLRTAAALAQLEPDQPGWSAAGPVAARALLGVDRRTIPRWVELFEPVLWAMIPKLQEDVRNTGLSPSARAASAEALAEALARRGLVAEFADPIAEATPDAFRVLVRALERLGFPAGATAALGEIVSRSATASPADLAQLEHQARRRANAAVALLALGHPDHVWPGLRHADDPRYRSLLVDRLGRFDVNPAPLLDHLRPEIDPIELQGVLLALAEIRAAGETGLDRISPQGVQRLVSTASDLYLKHPHPGVHSAAELLLERWKKGSVPAPAAKHRRRGPGRTSDRRWELGPNGHTLVILPGPLEFRMGSPPYEEGRFAYENQHIRRIDHSLAVATKEVTIAQFRVFRPEYPTEHRYVREPSCPANLVDWYAAAGYCNWLSAQDGIDPSQWCYPAESGPVMVVPARAIERSGYRLPTEAEWEYFCRAGTDTARPFGTSEELLPRYAWTWLTSGDRTRPVGTLLPNEFGLFDVVGNVWEWCHDGPLKGAVNDFAPYPEGTKDRPALDPMPAKTVRNDTTLCYLRGGAFDYAPAQARSGHRYAATASHVEGTLGFRVVRTLPPVAK
jgi:serine/threonine protein kinase/formylglycine-generating enzyme required for sulfatase activity